MKKRLKYLIIISLALVLTVLVSSKTYAAEETPVINKFIETINNAYDRYYLYDYNQDTLEKDLDLIIVEGVSENQMSISVYYKTYNNKFSDTFVIKKNDESSEFITTTGNELYNYLYTATDEVSILIYLNEDKNTAKEYVITHKTPESLLTGNCKEGLGGHEFPKSTVGDSSLMLKGCLAAVSVVGIFIAGILIIVIAVMITTKNIHIKRETTTYYTPRTNQYNPGTPNNAPGGQTIIDSTASEDVPNIEPKLEDTPKEPLSEEDELKRLYSLHARHEITDEELELLLRKYRGKRDDD